MRIFLSYGSQDRALAERVAIALTDRGHKVFFDRDKLPPGKSFNDRIRAEIAATDLLIFLISPQSVAQGRYTLTELDFAKHRWPSPSGFVLPVMVVPTPIANIPAYLKAVTIHEPAGDLVAGVEFAVDQVRGPDYVRRVVATFALAGLIAGLCYLGAKEGWIIRPEVPFVVAVAKGITALLAACCGPPSQTVPFLLLVGLVFALTPAAPLFGLVTWFAGGALARHAVLAAVVVAGAGGLAIAAGNLIYDATVPKWTELTQAQRELKFREAERKAQLGTEQERANATSPPPTVAPLEEALNLQWAAMRLEIGAAYGALVGLGFAAAGMIASLAMASMRRWIITAGSSAVAGGLLYAATNSLQLSFLLFHIGIFALMGYWIARGQS